jgi:hypothetical protein
VAFAGFEVIDGDAAFALVAVAEAAFLLDI